MADKTDMVIFTLALDLLTWLMPQCERFPKAQRFVVTQRLLGAALDFQEALHHANARSGTRRLQALQDADAHLSLLRLYLRLAHHWQWLSGGQYQHASRMVAELGRLLGGWLRQTRSVQSSAAGVSKVRGDMPGSDGT